MNDTYLLEKLIEKKDLKSFEIESLLDSCIRGEMSEIQLSALLVALRMKGETIDEISGLIHVMRKHSISFPKVINAIDTCGTGGDGLGTFNISTAVALVVAGVGLPVIKHGNKAASSKCGSADVLSELGVTITLTPVQAKAVFDAVGMVFLFAPIYHPAMKIIGPVRKALGTRTVFNYLGPFLNPSQVKRQIIGVPSIALAEKLAKVAVNLDYKHLILIAGESGLDEIGLHETTTIFEIKGNIISRRKIDPQEFGLKKSKIKTIQGGDVNENAEILKEILAGKKDARRDIVVLNSAFALLVSGKVKDVHQGIKLAEESIDKGHAKNVLQNLIKETNKYA